MSRLNLLHIVIIPQLKSIPLPILPAVPLNREGMTRNGKRRGVDRHWLGVILFVLPGETAAAAHRQRGSVVGLTFPFSCSQLPPFIPIESCSLRGRLGWRGHGRGWGWGGRRGRGVVGDSVPQLDGWFRGRSSEVRARTHEAEGSVSCRRRRVQRFPHPPCLSLCQGGE